MNALDHLAFFTQLLMASMALYFIINHFYGD